MMGRIEDNSSKVKIELEKRIRRLLVNACSIVERKAKQIVHRRSGELARSITHEIEGKVGRIGTNLPYGPWVELGTRPHEIRPKTKQALFWVDLEHPVKVVLHPGAKAYPYLRPALHQSKNDIEALIGRQG